MDAFQKRSGLDLPWHGLRRGKERVEPDFVIELESQIVVGFEVTEVEEQEVRQLNKMLKGKIAGEDFKITTKNPDQQEVLRDRKASVDDAHAIVACDNKLAQLQAFREVLSEDELADRIVNRVEAKKKKDYHQASSYPVHVIIYERNYIICKGKKGSALRRANEHKGHFAGVWYVEDGPLIAPSGEVFRRPTKSRRRDGLEHTEEPRSSADSE